MADQNDGQMIAFGTDDNGPEATKGLRTPAGKTDMDFNRFADMAADHMQGKVSGHLVADK